MHLDYLLPNAPDNLHLQEADPTGFLTSSEGGRGSLELLHPCPECPSMTKFQTLFVPDPMFDKYRLAFFLNSANNPGTGGDEWLLGTLSFLADEVDDQGQSDISTSLRRGVEIIRRRHACYGNLNLPLGCTSERAWQVCNKVVKIGDYWFNVVELQFLASLKNCSLRTFLHDASSSEDVI